MAQIPGIDGSLKGFDQFYIMTKGGPARATTTIMMYFYQNAFGYMEIGYGAAIAILFTLMVFIFVFVQRVLLSKMRGASGNN
jgi:multiple sugar transport system permease protein